MKGSKSEGHSHVGEEPRASSAGPIIAEPYQAARVHLNTHMVRRTVTRSTDQPGVLAQDKETLVLQLIGGRHLETTRINQASLRACRGNRQPFRKLAVARRLRQSREDQMHTFSKRSAVALIAAFLVTLAIAGLAQEQKFKAVPAKTPDGLTISAQDWGNPDGREILFIHGFSQSHLSWIKQMRSE